MRRRNARREPAQERSRALCAAIEEAAAHVLVKHGYDGANTARIAERAGVSIGSLYQYFGGKDAVFDALAARILGALVQAMGPALGTPGLTLEARVELGCAAAYDVVAPFPRVLRQLAAVPGTRFYARLSAARRQAMVAARMLLELHRDEVTVDDFDLSARILVDVAEGLLFNLDTCDDPARMARETRRLVALYCTGGRRARDHELEDVIGEKRRAT